MQIQSSGMQGLQSAQSGLTQATIDVAKPTPTQSSTPAAATREVAQPDKTSALLSANESLRQGEASTKVIEAGSETIGSIIDIKV
ncbi:chemotaxis protein [Shewanella glacialipiscicola]|uniref:Chemotaxis protein n=1 Tax=Shewanella glacialipiscicola TaxID=614069 RepID=A0ABQ6J1I9_9GAMM|nr:chemotaxis protein [Shewanella glacialipiscicola]MCL1085906.1 chemotaxis protein [Shewanella glacialipiscicola]MCU7993382.1 chemotaxis protein [Shewanella glacialipiscicola]MCU8024699.1 chemotaxis protein [Shewanella glacialipiscicola]GIU10085.1 chemotaxis protein [Shewanella glacialipiscicola]GMA81990.1 chemotaxis protein [Shewanella glacialipiscicola]